MQEVAQNRARNSTQNAENPFRPSELKRADGHKTERKYARDVRSAVPGVHAESENHRAQR